MGKITDKTWIPLGLAVVVIGGGAAWATNVQQAVSQVPKMKEQFQELVIVLVRLEGKIDALTDVVEAANKRRGRKND